MGKFEWERADNNIVMRVWENHASIRLDQIQDNFFYSKY
jgi:hypothetical protein